jgi:DNA modification methylase
MPQYNDLDINIWKQLNINTDSLWLINERDKSGKHENIYHGNFIPQIPNQLISRYTKKSETVFEPFMGSGTTLFECEKLGRKYIGFDINPKIVDYVRQKISPEQNFFIKESNSLSAEQVNSNFNEAFEILAIKSSQLVLKTLNKI